MLLFRKLGFSDSSGVLSKAGKIQKNPVFDLKKLDFVLYYSTKERV